MLEKVYKSSEFFYINKHYATILHNFEDQKFLKISTLVISPCGKVNVQN